MYFTCFKNESNVKICNEFPEIRRFKYLFYDI